MRYQLLHTHAMGRCASVIAIVLALLGLWLPTTESATAQTWHYVYGEDTTGQDGRSGVTAVTGICSDEPACSSCSTETDGYIAVGNSTHDGNGTGPDVYIVRTANDGSKIWEKTYDVTGDSAADEAFSIIELVEDDGFVVCGVVQPDGVEPPERAFLMKIDCDGNEVWTNMYLGPDSARSRLHNLTEAETGDGNTTNAGDIVACGHILAGNSDLSESAWLLRVESDGTVIWDKAYVEGDTVSRFNDLVEVETSGMQTTGDIVAVGNIDRPFLGTDGLVVRVDGDDGSINPMNTYQGVMHIGDEDADLFFSVFELENGNETGTNGQPNVVAAGMTQIRSGETIDQEIFLVKLDDGDPCEPNTQQYIGKSGEEDVAYDIREVPFEMTGSEVSQWDLVLTGYNFDQNGRMILINVDPGNLQWVTSGIGKMYLKDSNGDGWSVWPVDSIEGRTQGFIVCGSTTDDPASVNDPLDMHLVKTDETGSVTGACEESYSPSDTDPDYADSCISLDTETGTERISVTPDAIERDWGDEVCLPSGKALGPILPDRRDEENRTNEEIELNARAE